MLGKSLLMSDQPSSKKASEEAYLRDKVFMSMDFFPEISFYELLGSVNRSLGKKNFQKKVDSRKASCWSRSRSIPENETIRKEYVKCKKPNCRRKQHGPYYYAYWKDSKTKKLRKKYIGRHYFTADESKPKEIAKDMIGELPVSIYDPILW
jgi:hypothetical protein